jgi:intracellular sulfur oxidation DsrE/DsrF family protein
MHTMQPEVLMLASRRLFALFAAAALVTVAAPARAQQLPIPDVTAARDVPGAKELPDPSMEYKVMFMVGAGPKAEEVNPTLTAAARYINTLAKFGVPAEKRKIVLVIRGGMDMILKNDAYKAKHNGQDNPNIAMIQALKKAGADIRVCGQGVLGLKFKDTDILPEVQVDLWAMTTAINLQLRGWVRIG